MNNGKKHLHFLEMPPCWITSSNIWQFGKFGLLAPVQQRGVEGGLAAWFCQFFLTCLSGSLSFPLLFSFICPHLLRWPVYCSPGVPWGVGRGAWVVLTGALLSLRVCLLSLGFCAVLGHSLDVLTMSAGLRCAGWFILDLVWVSDTGADFHVCF